MKDKIINQLGESWYTLLQSDWESDYFKLILEKVEALYRTESVMPPPQDVFNIFKICQPDNIKVVWLGQDPYPTFGEAHGLSFSSKGKKIPASLRVIYKELENDLGVIRTTPDLTGWAQQGVFLLNKILTVKEGKPLSHMNVGWQEFTTNTITQISKTYDNLVFVLLGKEAQHNKLFIQGDHLIIELPHPAAEAYSGGKAGFYNSKLFSKINEYLESKNKTKINWNE